MNLIIESKMKVRKKSSKIFQKFQTFDLVEYLMGYLYRGT
jgi:hypothetical protein